MISTPIPEALNQRFFKIKKEKSTLNNTIVKMRRTTCMVKRLITTIRL